METNIIYLLKLIGMSLECAFCMGIITRIFLDRSKITLERIVLYGSGMLLGTVFIHFNVLEPESAEIMTYGFWALIIILFIYTGSIFYKAWAIWVATMIMYMAIGVMDLIVRVVFMQILGFSLAGMERVENFFWIPEIIAAIAGVYIFKRTPFYYKDKACYKHISVLKQIMILIMMTGIGTVVQASVLALDGDIAGIEQGSIKAFLRIYAGLIVGILWIFETYKDIHKTYNNREELLIDNFSKKQVKTAQQLEKVDKANQIAKENLHNKVTHLAKAANEAGLEEVKAYAEQLAAKVEPMNQEFLLTGHSILDAVLKEKYIAALEKHIKLVNKLSIPECVALSSTDLSIIVGQALDYAIRRCEEVDGERSIKIEGLWYKGYIILKVWYSTLDGMVKEEVKYKQQEIGIIQKYVRKYEGEFKESHEKARNKLELSFNATRG